MTLGPVIFDIEAEQLEAEDRELLEHPLTGGLILFTRNYADTKQLAELMREIRAVRSDILVCVDHEGGRVQRFREGFSRIPPMAALGRLYGRDRYQALQQAREVGWLFAAELRAFDIDLAFAPVLDLDYGVSSIIGDRAFADDPETVTALAAAVIEGMAVAGMRSTGKHFPGHGFIAADSHLELPVDERSLEEIQDQDIKPFRQLVDAGLSSVMPAHIVYPQVDDRPAGFSPVWIQEILRRELNFDGAVFSDDLSMEGAASTGSYLDRAEAALEAGCDLLLVCNNRAGAVEVFDHLAQRPRPETHRRASRLRGESGARKLAELRRSDRWSAAQPLLETLTA